MKNITIIKSNDKQSESWRIINNLGEPIEVFDIFAKLLLKKYSYNTRLSYCRNIALFIDYIEEVNLIYSEQVFTNSFLVDVIESFPDWLMFGENSSSDIAKNIQKTYPSPIYNKQSVDLIIVSLRLFLNISERIRLEQENSGLITDSKLFQDIQIKENVSIKTKNSLIKKSMIGGVVSEGPKLIKSCLFPLSSVQPYFSIDRAFPFDKIIPFIESFPTFRDKALYMLCAASGCRIHEALQILVEDIDIKNRTLVLINPHTRITSSSYQSLTSKERSKLSWKGRTTERVVLIHPFADLFFNYLEQYIKHEYIDHKKHSFVFQYIRGNQKGKPFFLSSPATRSEAFNKAAESISISKELNQGVHSLRHMYGTYLVNYFPKSDGSYGLPISIVQKIMGHSLITSTQKYARHDSDLIANELQYANNLLFNNEPSNLLEIKKHILKQQLIDLERKIDEI